jgi:hypothetical protein
MSPHSCVNRWTDESVRVSDDFSASRHRHGGVGGKIVEPALERVNRQVYKKG